MSQLWMDATKTGGGPLEGNEHYYFQQRTHEAALSCAKIADAEELLGYQESATAYREMAMEIREAGAWWMGQQSAIDKYRGMFVPPALRGMVH